MTLKSGKKIFMLKQKPFCEALWKQRLGQQQIYETKTKINLNAITCTLLIKN